MKRSPIRTSRATLKCLDRFHSGSDQAKLLKSKKIGSKKSCFLTLNGFFHGRERFADEKELEYPLNAPGWTIEARDRILETPFMHDRGTLQTPVMPGLGFKINQKALRKYGQRYFVMDRKRLIWFSLRTRGLKVSREIDRVRKEKKERRR